MNSFRAIGVIGLVLLAVGTICTDNGAKSRKVANIEAHEDETVLIDLPVADEPGSTAIPLSKIWANRMQGTQDINLIEQSVQNSAKQKYAVGPLIYQIVKAIAKQFEENQPIGPAFAVAGSGHKALAAAMEAMKEDAIPSQIFPAETEISLFFYTLGMGLYFQLKEVRQSKETVAIRYRYNWPDPRMPVEAMSKFYLLALATGGLLTGNGIGIGQVETFRPGDPTQPNGANFDTLANIINTSIDPAEVFFGRFTDLSSPNNISTFNPAMNNPLGDEIFEHALQVAGVIISTDTQPGGTPEATGVAVGANLYSAGDEAALNGQRARALVSQHIATRNNGDIRAINLSFAEPLSGSNALDGNSLYTQFVDWSASKHDTLYVSAGNQFTAQGTPDGLTVPRDNFNGLTVAGSEKVGGVYRRVWSENNLTSSVDAAGERTSVDIIAPAKDILLASQGSVNNLDSGTRLAAPHVTGTVALLQQYGDERILNSGNASQWNPSARRHEVMKSVLMNSADKIEDTSGTGKYLGMERTVLKQNGTDTWFDSEAFMELDEFGDLVPDTDTPLDEEMGAGNLNAKRALQQFLPVEQDFNGTDGFAPPVGDVPLIGWDYGTIAGASHPFSKYVLDTPLEAGDFISITLAWDREVEFANDADMDGEYDAGDTFEEYTDLDDVLVDLDLYLIPAGETNIGEEIAISNSRESSVEHLFAEIPFDGDYEIWVYRNEQFASAQDYGIAWWYGLAPELVPPTLSGDFDNDDDVDGADFLAWQRNTNLGSLSDWESEYGSGTLAAASIVPEPNDCLFLMIGLPLRLGRCPTWLYNDETS